MMRDARRCTRRTIEASSATHIAPHVPAGLHSGHIEAPDIGITRGMPSSTTSTTSKTMTASFSTSMTVPPARSERPLSGNHAAEGGQLSEDAALAVAEQDMVKHVIASSIAYVHAVAEVGSSHLETCSWSSLSAWRDPGGRAKK